MKNTNKNKQYDADFRSEKGYFCAIISYLGFFWLIGFFLRPENQDPKVRFHIGQGIILFIFTAVGQIALYILTQILSASQFSYTDPIILSLRAVFFVGISLLMIKGALNAQKREETKIPVIGTLSFYS